MQSNQSSVGCILYMEWLYFTFEELLLRLRLLLLIYLLMLLSSSSQVPMRKSAAHSKFRIIPLIRSLCQSFVQLEYRVFVYYTWRHTQNKLKNREIEETEESGKNVFARTACISIRRMINLS